MCVLMLIKAACQDKLGGKPEYFYTEEWFTCGLISGGEKKGGI